MEWKKKKIIEYKYERKYIKSTILLRSPEEGKKRKKNLKKEMCTTNEWNTIEKHTHNICRKMTEVNE